MNNPDDRVVFTLHKRRTGEQQVAYSRACHDEDEWSSASSARYSLCGGEYHDREKYVVKKWLVTYTLLEDDA